MTEIASSDEISAQQEKWIAPRDTTRWSMNKFLHPNIETLLASEPETGIHSTDPDGHLFDFYYKAHEAETMFVFFHGAIAEIEAFPVFSGVGIGKQIPAGRLLFSDMTLHARPGLGLGWFMGTSDHKYADDIVKVINWIAEKHKYRRIVLIGGSGGGHTALRIGRRIPGSISFVWNPQNDIGDYYKSLTGKFSAAVFQKDRFQDIDEDIRREYEMHLSEAYGSALQSNYILYMQNLSDDMHLRKHAATFHETLTGRPGPEEAGAYQMNERAHLVIGDWGDGHITPPRDTLVSLLQVFADPGTDLAALFRDGTIGKLSCDALAAAGDGASA